MSDQLQQVLHRLVDLAPSPSEAERLALHDLVNEIGSKKPAAKPADDEPAKKPAARRKPAAKESAAKKSRAQ